MTARGVALVRGPGSTLAEGIVTHIEREAVDVALAREQHAAYVAALEANGWATTPVEPSEAHPDAVFVEDAVIVVGDLAILARSGAEQRRGERPEVEAAARELGLRIAEVEDPGTLDGGDVLQVGDTIYIGRGGRTNGEAIRQVRALTEPLGRRVVPVPLKSVLHLKSAVTALPDGTLIGLPDLIDTTGLPSLRPAEEEGGAHVVPLGGGSILIAASAPRTAAQLDDLGFDPVVVDISEFEKLEGCVTCLSVLIPTMR